MVLDPELLLWKPGAKTIFVPPVTGWAGGNAFIMPEWVTREALRSLSNNLRFTSFVNSGQRVAITMPPRYSRAA